VGRVVAVLEETKDEEGGPERGRGGLPRFAAQRGDAVSRKGRKKNIHDPVQKRGGGNAKSARKGEMSFIRHLWGRECITKGGTIARMEGKKLIQLAVKGGGRANSRKKTFSLKVFWRVRRQSLWRLDWHTRTARPTGGHPLILSKKRLQKGKVTFKPKDVTLTERDRNWVPIRGRRKGRGYTSLGGHPRKKSTASGAVYKTVKKNVFSGAGHPVWGGTVYSLMEKKKHTST